MISRRSAKIIGEVYDSRFTYSERSGSRRDVFVSRDLFYDFLFECDYPAWICNMVKNLYDRRDIKEWIMQMHTGESFAKAYPGWLQEDREKLGQKCLINFAGDFVRWLEKTPEAWQMSNYSDKSQEIVKSLELDGYTYKNGLFLPPESDVLDVEEESGILQSLYVSLGLDEKQTAFHHLELSETHYIDGRWGDSISNSRKFLECVLTQVAAKHSLSVKNTALAKSVAGKPVKVREYLEHEGLLETKEKEALAKVYGLLSHTGSHPYMAENDQARLLRHLALTFCQFVMLRLQGELS